MGIRLLGPAESLIALKAIYRVISLLSLGILKTILILITILLLILYTSAEPLYYILLTKVPTFKQVGSYKILVLSIYRISYIYTRLIPT